MGIADVDTCGVWFTGTVAGEIELTAVAALSGLDRDNFPVDCK